MSCNVECHCDYVPYAPVCSETGQQFISPCHAGCRGSEDRNGTKVFIILLLLIQWFYFISRRLTNVPVFRQQMLIFYET